MGCAELTENLEAQPSKKPAAVLDFVDFLLARFGTSGEGPRPRSDWTDAEFAELAMAKLFGR